MSYFFSPVSRRIGIVLVVVGLGLIGYSYLNEYETPPRHSGLWETRPDPTGPELTTLGKELATTAIVIICIGVLGIVLPPVPFEKILGKSRSLPPEESGSDGKAVP
jgi:hypothetical protein